MISIRPATQVDARAFYGKPSPVTFRGLVAVDGDDNPVGIGGYYLSDSVAVAFSDHSEAMSKRDRVRAAHALMKLLKGLDMEVFAAAPLGDATVMKHFGFEPFGMFWRLQK